MYVTSPKRKNGARAVRIMHSERKGKKVIKRVVRTLGQSKDPAIIKRYQKMAENLVAQHKKGLICLDEKLQKHSVNIYNLRGHELLNTGFKDIFGFVYNKIGFSKLIITGRNHKSNNSLNSVLKSHVLMRLFCPSSKLKSCELIEKYFKKAVSYDQSLNMMDHLHKNLDEMKEIVFSQFLKREKVCDVLLFDVTTLYFESTEKTELKNFGYSKDAKFGEVQIVLAVLANREGMPLAYEVFPGNTSEKKTFKAVLDAFVKRYNVRRIKVTADRAMFSDDNFKFFEELEEDEGIKADYLVSAPLKKLPKAIKEEIFDFKRQQLSQKETKGYHCFSYNNRKMYVSFCEKRRRLDEKKRQKKLDKIRKYG